MTATVPLFDHSTLNIPGITLPDEPAAAARMLTEKAQTARRASGPTLSHADVMRDMTAIIGQISRSS